jgi:hypothetical protein
MKTALVLTFSFVAASFAQDFKASPVKEPDIRSSTGEVKRLGSVTWDLDAHKLVWVVQKGSMVNGEFVAGSEQKYEISPDKAAMMVADEERGFDGDEAVSLHHLLDVLSLYCAESVVWWDEGQGTPATAKQPTNGQEKPKADKSDPKPVKVGQPDQNKKPKYKVPADHMVARAQY